MNQLVVTNKSNLPISPYKSIYVCIYVQISLHIYTTEHLHTQDVYICVYSTTMKETMLKETRPLRPIRFNYINISAAGTFVVVHLFLSTTLPFFYSPWHASGPAIAALLWTLKSLNKTNPPKMRRRRRGAKNAYFISLHPTITNITI